MRAAVGDLDGDGQFEIVTAPLAGRIGEIRVFASGGTELVPYRTQPFGPRWLGGVNLAVGDTDGDGRVDSLLVTRRGQGVRTLSFANVISGPLGGSVGGDLFAAECPSETPGTIVTTPSGLQYRDVVVGTGSQPSSSTATVRVNDVGGCSTAPASTAPTGSSSASIR